MGLGLFIDLIIILMALLPLFQSALKKDSEGKDLPFRLKNMSWSGWALIFLGTSYFLLGLWKKSKDDEATKQDKIDLRDQVVREVNANVNKALAAYNLQFKNNSIVVIRDTMVINKPTEGERIQKPSLNFVESPFFYLKDDPDSSLKIRVMVKNTDLGLAKNLKDWCVHLTRRNGTLFVSSLPTQASNEYSTVAGGEVYFMDFSYGMGNRLASDTDFLYFRLGYADVTGKSQPPIRRIFIVPFPKPGLILDAKNDDFKIVKSFLQTQKLW